MLFEREPLTPKGRYTALNRLFADFARRGGAKPEPGHVPVEVLSAHGDLDSHVRFMLEAAHNRPQNREQRRRLHQIEKVMDALPTCIMETLPAGPDENWLCLYRKLVQLHGLLEDLEPGLDAEEYAAIVQKMVQLAGAVARFASVEVNAASMFALLLIQVHLHKHSPARRRSHRAPKAKARSTKAQTKKRGA